MLLLIQHLPDLFMGVMKFQLSSLVHNFTVILKFCWSSTICLAVLRCSLRRGFVEVDGWSVELCRAAVFTERNCSQTAPNWVPLAVPPIGCWMSEVTMPVLNATYRRRSGIIGSCSPRFNIHASTGSCQEEVPMSSNSHPVCTHIHVPFSAVEEQWQPPCAGDELPVFIRVTRTWLLRKIHSRLLGWWWRGLGGWKGRQVY